MIHRDYFILDYEKPHFTDELHFDLRVQETEVSNQIAGVFLTSKTVDISNISLGFRSVFGSIDGQNYLTSDKSWPVFSHVMVDAIQSERHRCTFVKSEITGAGALPVTYQAASIPRMTDCVDLRRSKYVEHELLRNRFARVERLELKRDTEYPAMFRLHEFSTLILISESLKRRFESLSDTRFTLDHLSTFSSYNV